MADVDWDAEWEIQSRDMLSFGVMCNTCTGQCDCTKRLWIDRRKQELGLQPKKTKECSTCHQQVVHVFYHSSSLQTPHVPICDECLDVALAHSK